MTNKIKNKSLNTFKPDLEDAAKRWQAYWCGEIIDRPVVWASCAVEGFVPKAQSTYYERVHGDMDTILENALYNAQGTYYAAEAIPSFWISFGADEIAAFCGGKLEWNKGSALDTNWSASFVMDWNKSLPLKLQQDNPIWLRMLEFYRKAVEVFNGSILPMPLDFHTNMDLLLAARGGEQLCTDLIDQPEIIDCAMEDARRIFLEVWEAIRKACRMDEFGYWYHGYSPGESVNFLACDFSCMIGRDMFRRWVLPTLEFEASYADRVIYHWDGPAALRHYDDLMSIDKIHTFWYVPDPFERHTKYIDLYKKMQKAGKGVYVTGTVDEIKLMHKELDPARTVYIPEAASRNEIDKLLEWLVKNT